MSAIIDSFDKEFLNTTGTLYEGIDIGVGQSFTGNGAYLDSAAFKIYKEGSPTGDCYASIYSHSGTYGTSSVGDSLLATSSVIDVSTLGTSTSPSFTTFTFTGDQRISILNEVYYVVVMNYSGGDSDNYIRWKGNQPSEHSGNKSGYRVAGWTPSDYLDLAFQVYGTTPAIGSSYPLPAFKRP